MAYLTSAFARNGRRYLWAGLLIAASVALTLGFACAVPFAAFGTVAALTMPRREALLLAVALWLVNQVIGFTALHYPWDGMTLLWGAILGGMAVLSTGAAQAASMALRGHPSIVLIIASFIAAFVVYEGGLYLISIPMAATEDFTASIVVRILEINAAGCVVLLAFAMLFPATISRVGSLGGGAAPLASR